MRSLYFFFVIFKKKFWFFKVGVNYTEADIIKEINNFFNKNIEELKKMRYIVKSIELKIFIF